MIQINILSKDKKIYQGEALSVTLPGKEGQFQVLEGHAPAFSLLKKGKILIQEQKKVIEIIISAGIVRVLNNKALILVQQ